ncbi:MAG: type II toxin-antitoxin system Phd/YefM family antitoxin [Deltaproteobacteria bacterium]|nr:type II toxin-antitoxin system Phd/YefM family antitoxin [Deltaproteobacteria bacterium]
MKTVGLKVLKNKLSEYVRAAENGETFLIADRDRVVAELVPPAESRSPRVADAVLADLVRNGLLTPALHPPGPPPPSTPVAPWTELARELAQDREDR